MDDERARLIAQLHTAHEQGVLDDAAFRASLVALDPGGTFSAAAERSTTVQGSGSTAVGPADFRWQKKNTRRSAAVMDTADLSHLLSVAERLKNVQFLSRDALGVIAKMRGTGALIYFDPPYVHSTRRNRRGYRHEPDDDWHAAAAELLRAHDGPVVVAGYVSALYAGLYEAHGWARHERGFVTNSGGRGVECLWLSPAGPP